MATKGFKKISRGYMEGFDYEGYGYFIEKEQAWDNTEWWVYRAEDCKLNEDGCLDTSNANPLKKFDYLADAKTFCKDNH